MLIIPSEWWVGSKMKLPKCLQLEVHQKEYLMTYFLLQWYDFTLITWNTPKQFVVTNFCCSVFFLGDQNCKSYNFSYELNQKWKQQITKKLTIVWVSRTINFVRKYRFLSCAFFIFPLRETATLEWFKRDVLEVLR